MHVPKWLKKLFADEGYWLDPYEEWGLRRGFAESLRWVADRIGPEDAFSSAGSRFAHRVGVGRVDYFDALSKPPRQEYLLDKNKGVPLWYRVSDYKTRGWEER